MACSTSECCDEGACRSDVGDKSLHEPNAGLKKTNVDLEPPRKNLAACMKCKSKVAKVLVRQNDPVCSECSYGIALSKVRQCLRLKMQISAADKVLVCFSGGLASRAMLKMLQDCQSQDKGRPGRSKMPFELLVAHVEESACCGSSEGISDRRQTEIWESIKNHVSRDCFLDLRIEDVFPSNGQGPSDPRSRLDRRKQLQSLIQEVTDSTGRQDLVKTLREALLLSTAQRLSVTRIARGDSASRLAARVIALSAKGNGFAIPASMHYLDARHGEGQPMWISPVRDLTAKDLAMVTHFCRLQTVPKVEVPQFGSQVSINTLAEQFVAGLSVGMPSTVYAVLGTACKLVPFRWNTPQGCSEGSDRLDKCCKICSSPMQSTIYKVHAQLDSSGRGRICRSCQQQFWGLSASSSMSSAHSVVAARFQDLMPPQLFPETDHEDVSAEKLELRSAEWLKDQVQDCLL